MFCFIALLAVATFCPACCQCPVDEAPAWSMPSSEILITAGVRFITGLSLEQCQSRCLNPNLNENDVPGCTAIHYSKSRGNLQSQCDIFLVRKEEVGNDLIAESPDVQYYEWTCQRSWQKHTTPTRPTSSSSTTQPMSTTRAPVVSNRPTTSAATGSESSLPVSTTSTQGVSMETVRVVVLFQGSYDEMIGAQKMEWEDAAYPQIASAAEVTQSRIQDVVLSPGSIQLEFKVLPPNTSQEISSQTAAENVRSKVNDGSFTLSGPTNSVTLPPEPDSTVIYVVTATTVAAPSSSDNKVLGLEPVYIAMIGLAVLIVLLLTTAIVIIVMFNSRSSKRDSGSDSRPMYVNEEDTENPHQSSYMSTIEAQDKSNGEVESVDTLNY